MIEKPPTTNYLEAASTIMTPQYSKLEPLINKINDEYEYWDSVKYKKRPEGYSAEQLWNYVKLSRFMKNTILWDKYGIHMCITNYMQQTCHELDMNFGGFWGSESILPPQEKERYLVSSLMEEAISSSQMEGASTTRVVAKEMLRKKISPKNKSQQMIVNNYNTIQYIVNHRDEPLTKESLLHIHKLMTDNAIDNPDAAGRFRDNDDVVVANIMENEIVHRPPSVNDIPAFVDTLCTVFNTDSYKTFIHPIIRGIIIHFMVAYMHPFADGNGRTARALFYWYMLKEKYWMTEYLSISRIIARSKNSYEKSFRYTEMDGNDIGYFVTYNLKVIQKAFQELQQYIQRKTAEKEAASSFMLLGNINERQAQIIQLYINKPKEIHTVKDFEIKFSVTAMTAKRDIVGLVERGILEEISINKVKKGYVKGARFNDAIAQIKKETL